MTKEEQMYALLDQQAGSGQTIRDFCKEQNMSPAKFQYWRQRRRKQGSLRQVGDNSKGFTTLIAQPDPKLRICLSGGLELSFATADLIPAATLILELDRLHRAGL